MCREFVVKPHIILNNICFSVKHHEYREKTQFILKFPRCRHRHHCHRHRRRRRLCHRHQKQQKQQH